MRSDGPWRVRTWSCTSRARPRSLEWDEQFEVTAGGTINVLRAAAAAGRPALRADEHRQHDVRLGMGREPALWPPGGRRAGCPAWDLLDYRTPPRPDSPYGAAKLFCEAAARWFSDQTPMSVLVIRLGAVLSRGPADAHPALPGLPGPEGRRPDDRQVPVGAGRRQVRDLRRDLGEQPALARHDAGQGGPRLAADRVVGPSSTRPSSRGDPAGRLRPTRHHPAARDAVEPGPVPDRHRGLGPAQRDRGRPRVGRRARSRSSGWTCAGSSRPRTARSGRPSPPGPGCAADRVVLNVSHTPQRARTSAPTCRSCSGRTGCASTTTTTRPSLETAVVGGRRTRPLTPDRPGTGRDRHADSSSASPGIGARSCPTAGPSTATAVRRRSSGRCPRA